MNHLSIEELLGLRDGAAPEEHSQHLTQCAECAAELERLHDLRSRLTRLPVSRPERDVWPAVRVAAEANRWRGPWIWGARVVATLAATFTLAVGVRGTVDAWRESRLTRETHALMAESQRLEQALRSYDTSGRVVAGRTAGAVAELENQIALIDGQLAQAQTGRATSRDLLDLWQERVRLLDAMASVQTTRVAYVGL
jgi:hypothetical protein